MSEIHALSGAFAVDALDGAERLAFETHMEGCETCRDEVESLREAASTLSALSVLAPSERMRSSILGSISEVRPLPPIPAPSSAPDLETRPVAESTSTLADEPTSLDARRDRPRGGARVARRSHRGRWLAAAAAVVLLGGVGWGAVTQPWQDDETTQQMSVADQVIAAPDVVTQTARLSGGATATLYRSSELGKAVLTTRRLRDPAQDSVYQMWLQAPDGTFVDAGLMPRGANHTIVLKGDAADAVGAGITVEPAGGSPQPTSDPIALFDLKADA